jgi:hypothetical protein
MKVRRHLWLLVAAGLLAQAGCSNDEPRAAADEPDFVVLKDDEAEPDQMLGRPGAYAMTARGHETPPYAVVDVPAGFANFGFFAMYPAADDDDLPFLAVQYWTVYGVHPAPCDRDGAAPQIGTSVEDLAAALEQQRPTRVSSQEPVSLGGHDGLYLELKIPRDVSFEGCGGDGYYVYWEGSLNDRHHTASEPGSVERLWILDVDGVRVVLAAITGAGATAAQAEELTDIVTSVRFVDPM